MYVYTAIPLGIDYRADRYAYYYYVRSEHILKVTNGSILQSRDNIPRGPQVRYEGLINRSLIKYSAYVFKRYPAPSPADSLNFNAQTCDAPSVGIAIAQQLRSCYSAGV